MKKYVFILFFLSIIFSACGSLNSSRVGDVSYLREGMTQSQVNGILGRPIRTLSSSSTQDGLIQVFEYHTYHDEAYAVEFWDGRMSRYDFMYDNSPVTPSPGYYPSPAPGYRPTPRPDSGGRNPNNNDQRPNNNSGRNPSSNIDNNTTRPATRPTESTTPSSGRTSSSSSRTSNSTTKQDTKEKNTSTSNSGRTSSQSGGTSGRSR